MGVEIPGEAMVDSQPSGELPYPRAQRLRGEGKSNAEIVAALMGSGLSEEDARFVVSSMPGGAHSHERRAQGGGARSAPSDDDESSAGTPSGALPGWVWFVLVYGVGNVILYSTTGILLIPIPRR